MPIMYFLFSLGIPHDNFGKVYKPCLHSPKTALLTIRLQGCIFLKVTEEVFQVGQSRPDKGDPRLSCKIIVGGIDSLQIRKLKALEPPPEFTHITRYV